MFPGSPLFLGGDEVKSDCWAAVPQIQAWLKARGMTVDQLQAYFEQVLTRRVAQGSGDVLFWQEVFQNAPSTGSLPAQSVISVWKGPSPTVLADVVRAGFRAVSSGAWYLDQINSGTSWGREWEDYYTFDPQVGRKGGMWGEQAKRRFGDGGCLTRHVPVLSLSRCPLSS